MITNDLCYVIIKRRLAQVRYGFDYVEWFPLFCYAPRVRFEIYEVPEVPHAVFNDLIRTFAEIRDDPSPKILHLSDD